MINYCQHTAAASCLHISTNTFTGIKWQNFHSCRLYIDTCCGLQRQTVMLSLYLCLGSRIALRTLCLTYLISVQKIDIGHGPWVLLLFLLLCITFWRELFSRMLSISCLSLSILTLEYRFRLLTINYILLIFILWIELCIIPIKHSAIIEQRVFSIYLKVK